MNNEPNMNNNPQNSPNGANERMTFSNGFSPNQAFQNPQGAFQASPDANSPCHQPSPDYAFSGAPYQYPQTPNTAGQGGAGCVNPYPQGYYVNPPAPDETVGIWEWIWSVLVTFLPFGIVFTLIFAFGDSKPSKKNFFRAMLIMRLAAVVLLVILMVILFAFASEIPELF